MKAFYSIAIFAGAALLVNACKKSDSTTVATNPIPSLVAIAKGSLPSTLESTSVTSSIRDDAKQIKYNPLVVDTNLTEVKTRLFSPGPTDFMYRLYMIDSRLAEIAQNIKNCENTTTQTYTPPVVATGFSFPMKFSCVSTIDASSMGVSSYKVYYGKEAGYWYLGEFQTNSTFASAGGNPPTMASLAKVSEDGNEMTVYQISVENPSGSNYYASVMQILANKTTNVFEISTASSADHTQTISPGANYSGLGCGVQMKTDNTLVYASGKFDQITACPSTATVCANSEDLSTTTGCTTPLTTFSTSAWTRADISGTQAKSMIVDGAGLPTF